MDLGYITIAVRSAGGAIPVQDAVVTVKDADGNILYVEFTDRSGSTPRLSVPAPPKENSQSPNPSSPPFYSYNIDTDKPGYRSVRNLSIPVYPGVTSIQPVELLPIPEGVSNVPEIYPESYPPQL